MSSSICPHFTQNAWKKDLCSNCFKSKDEHKQQSAHSHTSSKFSVLSKTSKIAASLAAKADFPNKHKTPAKSIIKKAPPKSGKARPHKVSFPKNLTEVIGYGGEWSENDSDDDDDHDFMNLGNERDEHAATNTDDEETIELKRITRANTDFNMNNGNLLGDPQENIKKSFAALKLGAPQVDKEGKKQTLKISVVPFGAPMPAGVSAKAAAPATPATPKAKLEAKQAPQEAKGERQSVTIVQTAKQTTSLTASLLAAKQEAASDSDGKNSPPLERAMEKSLLDEISETLEQKQNESKKEQQAQTDAANAASASSSASSSKIKFEISSLAEPFEPKPFLDLKKPISRNCPIAKDQTKPKINVFHKYSDSESNCSDTENGISAYYDVVESHQLSYENLPDGKTALPKASQPIVVAATATTAAAAEKADKAVFSSSQYITDMLLSSKTRAASYNLHEGNFMTSQITSDGLIVTKCSSDDALDSTGSSFDGSSDEETSYNMIRSESDSGIGISIGSDYRNLKVEQKRSASTNNSDYEDIQVSDQRPLLPKVSENAPLKMPGRAKLPLSLDKSRELHGEPDGSADPDGSLEGAAAHKQTNNKGGGKEANTVLPALPKSPPPTKSIDARPSFLHGLQKQHPPLLLKKPDLPAKPIVSPSSGPLKTFMAAKRPPTNVEQSVINQLQLVMTKSSENLNADLAKDDAKLKKGRAPNPPPELKTSAPPTPERDYSIAHEFEERTREDEAATAVAVAKEDAAKPSAAEEEQRSPKAQPEPKPIEENGQKSLVKIKPETDKKPAGSEANATAFASLYTRKLPAPGATNGGASPVIREKDKRERATVNPKFRSLNTFVTQRNNAAKALLLQSASSSLNLKQPLTPEPSPRNHKNLSMSEECLAATLASSHADKKASTVGATTSPPKVKTKFSIKKFLRMGASKTTDNLHKKDGIYSEICTGEEANVVGKPRLVIIHPIDINPTAVEVVRDITKTNEAVSSHTVAVVTAKPPAPPQRAADGQRPYEVNKPARPPPPKSAELRRKQKNGLCAIADGAEVGGSVKCKADNVYANLGEIRSSIAPRKPERTASMREREAQLELARKRHGGPRSDTSDTVSICSSNGDNVSALELSVHPNGGGPASKAGDGKPPTGSRSSTAERKKSDTKVAIASKLEIFEGRAGANNALASAAANGVDGGRPSSLKDTVRKINSTIDSYLKDKRDYENMYDFVKTPASPPPPPARSVDLSTGQRLLQPRRNNLYSDTASVASYTRSEYGPGRGYGLNHSIANIPRIISASYCGSEVGEFDIYAPYSYYGSEAGGDVAGDINDSVWGVPSAAKNRSKATNRLRMRKGRSVVHKTIEDNYTAVVVANHEALAQVLDQLQQTPVIPPALRPLANAINLRFEDFTMLEGAQAFVVGKKAFHAALWTTAPVTLALSADSNQLAGFGGELSQLSGGISGVLNPITEFCDLVPSYHLPLMPSTEVTLLQATISVLPRLQLDTLQSIGVILKGKSQVLDKSNFNFRGSIPNLAGLKEGVAGGALRNVVSVQNLSTLNEEGAERGENGELTTPTGMPAFDDVMTREVAFIMLQLVNGMKNLQVKAIEDMPLSLSNVVLSKDIDNKDAQARLCVLQGNNSDEDEPMGTLCKCALIALTEMLPSTKVTPIVSNILLQERAESLSKAKSVLEFVLWGPSDVVLSGSTKERELALQRWLDLERATVLHGLVRTRVELTVYDECHLMFLVRSTAKMMNDAAKIVCSYQQQQPATASEQQD